jgi:hypothetical protein
MSSAYDDIKRAFDEMKTDGSKITKNAVATRAKRNIANLSKVEEKWVNLRIEIEDAQSSWEKKRKEVNKDELIKQLEAKVSNLKSKLANEKKKNDIDPKVYDNRIEELLVLLQEMYAAIDKLKLINADLQNQLVHSGQQREIRVNKSTGEIIQLISSINSE